MTMLSQAEIHALFEYKDGALYWRKHNGKCPAGTRAGYKNTNGYVQIGIRGKRYYAHRLIYMLFHNQLPEFLDHIDGNRSNNRYENLRPATANQNMHNRKRSVNNTSGVKGVAWAEHANKWLAYCWVDKKQYHLGYYADLAEAAEAVKVFREKHHGEYARV